MNKWRYQFASTLLFLSAFMCVPFAEAEKKVGVILGLTGPAAVPASTIRNAMQLAVRDEPDSKVLFIFEDDAFQPKNAVTAAKKLIGQDHVDALITFAGGPSTAVSSIAESAQVPMVGITAAEGFVQGKQYSYRIFMSSAEQAAALSAELERRSLSKIAVVTSANEAMVQVRDAFLALQKGEIVYNEELSAGEADANTVAAKIKSKSPDAVMLLLLPPYTASLPRALRTQGYRGLFFGSAPIYNPPEIEAAQGALEGAWFPVPDSEKVSEFRKRYAATFHTPATPEAVYGYDLARMLLQGQAASTYQEYFSALRTFDGLAGAYQRRGHSLDVPMVVRKVHGKEYEALQ